MKSAHEATDDADDRAAAKAVLEAKRDSIERRLKSLYSELDTVMEVIRLRRETAIDLDDWNIIANQYKTAMHLATRIAFTTVQLREVKCDL